MSWFALRVQVISCVLVGVGMLPGTPRQSGFAISHVAVIDPADARVRRDMTVVIREDRIEAVEPSAHIALPAGIRDVDAEGKFLIPGLWDMHVHLSQAGTDAWTRTVLLPLLIANGVTGVRDMGGNLEFIQQLRKDIASRAVLGPEIVSAGPMVIGPTTKQTPEVIPVTTAADGKRAVDTLIGRGVDFIKVMTEVPRDPYFALAAEANKRHFVFVGHVPEAVSARDASAAGQKSVEHFTGVWLYCSRAEDELRRGVSQGLRAGQPFILERINNHLPPRGAIDSYDDSKCRQLFATFARNHTWQTPTLISTQWTSAVADKARSQKQYDMYVPRELLMAVLAETADVNKLAPQDVRDVAEYYDRSLPFVREMRDAGVRFLAGTDTPYPPAAGFSLHDELALLVNGGLTKMDALRTATTNVGDFLGREAVGRIRAGCAANLVLLDANPLDDIRNTQRIRAVVLRGELLDRKMLDSMLARVAAAARGN